MKTCDFFSACAEDLKKAVNPNDNEAMIMIGMFPNDDRATVVINGIGVNIVAALCAAFDSNKNFKVPITSELKARTGNLVDTFRDCCVKA